ncbi:uncharacterized protein F5891DRAFT_1196688 [Suillus fuscotomentosus]|uniref:Uncharacterized protein n=1 Tax=Suillus fuscotomentosus TaxID=1912939 RepID=A0AAD4DSY4_9AGAM|nr:uncharacterized protein F5891DRAFT_1196688 [Suillus fuscotomentosus]KAG1893237.1 hypothetical protein F5891DRAFT_1196688 [Suillus fuscotomentosus]
MPPTSYIHPIPQPTHLRLVYSVCARYPLHPTTLFRLICIIHLTFTSITQRTSGSSVSSISPSPLAHQTPGSSVSSISPSPLSHNALPAHLYHPYRQIFPLSTGWNIMRPTCLHFTWDPQPTRLPLYPIPPAHLSSIIPHTPGSLVFHCASHTGPLIFHCASHTGPLVSIAPGTTGPLIFHCASHTGPLISIAPGTTGPLVFHCASHTGPLVSIAPLPPAHSSSIVLLIPAHPSLLYFAYRPTRLHCTPYPRPTRLQLYFSSQPTRLYCTSHTGPPVSIALHTPGPLVPIIPISLAHSFTLHTIQPAHSSL